MGVMSLLARGAEFRQGGILEKVLAIESPGRLPGPSRKELLDLIDATSTVLT
jgi:hypothetical protein